jgi:HEAT repeat protein
MRHPSTYRAAALAALLWSAPASPAVHAQATAAAKPDAKAAAKSGAQAKPAKAAAKRKKAAGADKPNPAIENAKGMMGSSKRENVEAGIQSLGLLGTAEAVEPLAERIRQGLPPDLLETAIVTLMALGQPNAGAVLHELSMHRRPEVRLRAIEAIAATNPPGAERTLTAALSDADTRVRSAAAVGLGEIHASSAVEKLFLALDRGNMEASGAIGKIIAPTDVPRLSGYLGQVPFRNLGPALAEVLQRTDVAEKSKLEIVARLQEVGTPEVKGYLGDLIAQSGQTLSPNLSRALLRAMQEIAN